MSPTPTMIDVRERCAPTFSWTGPYPIGQPPKPSPKPRGPYLPLRGGTMRGSLFLYRDPEEPMEAATMQWVLEQIAEGGTFIDAPADGQMYVRMNHDWHELAIDGGVF